MAANLDLFSSPKDLESIGLPDAELRFARAFYDQGTAGQYYKSLLRDIDWRHEKILVYGKERLQPRLTAWHGDPDSAYSYSGLTLSPIAWTATLQVLKTDIEAATGKQFNSVLLNLYRDEKDSVGWHSDNETELGAKPVIASLSLGATRIFKLRHKSRKDLDTFSLALSSGSLLIMEGTTQRYWQHAVEKEKLPAAPRINLTFRYITPA